MLYCGLIWQAVVENSSLSPGTPIERRIEWTRSSWGWPPIDYKTERENELCYFVHARIGVRVWQYQDPFTFSTSPSTLLLDTLASGYYNPSIFLVSRILELIYHTSFSNLL